MRAEWSTFGRERESVVAVVTYACVAAAAIEPPHRDAGARDATHALQPLSRFRWGWYLGQRDWNPVGLRFNITQPVAGPFLSPTLGGLRFTYLDTAGGNLTTPVANTRAIASIRAALRAQTKHTVGVLATSNAVGKRTDTATVVIMLHNRR